MIKQLLLPLFFLISFPLLSQNLKLIGGITGNSTKITNFQVPNPSNNANPIGTNYITLVDRTKLSSSFFVGINLDLFVKNKTGFSTGLLYIRRSLYDKSKYDFQQIGIPLNFTYPIYPKFKVLAGPEVDFAIGKGIENVDKVNVSGVLGIQFNPNSLINFGINYNRNLSSILKATYDKKLRFDFNTILISLSYPI
jgi:Outer membrane protein beta-barrel domain